MYKRLIGRVFIITFFCICANYASAQSNRACMQGVWFKHGSIEQYRDINDTTQAHYVIFDDTIQMRFYFDQGAFKTVSILVDEFEYNNEFLECEGNEFCYSGGSDLHCHEKVERVPYFIEKLIYVKNEAVLNYRYFTLFLGLEVSAICVDSLDIFDSVDGELQGILVRHDLVEKLEKQGDWVKVRCLENDEVYWTYSSCLE